MRRWQFFPTHFMLSIGAHFLFIVSSSMNMVSANRRTYHICPHCWNRAHVINIYGAGLCAGAIVYATELVFAIIWSVSISQCITHQVVMVSVIFSLNQITMIELRGSRWDNLLITAELAVPINRVIVNEISQEPSSYIGSFPVIYHPSD